MKEMQALDLVIDMGNTRVKAGLFQSGRWIRGISMAPSDQAALSVFLDGTIPRRIAVGSVSSADAAFMRYLENMAPITVLEGSARAPISNAYTTPLSLGVDRLANAVGAVSLFPTRPVLAIDLGTCITYDLVDASSVYRGGAITPGMHMRARAMHAYSARLPEVDPPENAEVLGTSTIGSLASGIHHGTLMELQGLIGFFKQQYPDLVVVLTGGDAPRFARALKNGIFAHPTLTLIGLHALLHHASSGGFAAVS